MPDKFIEEAIQHVRNQFYYLNTTDHGTLLTAIENIRNQISDQLEIGDVYGNAFRAGQRDILKKIFDSLSK